MRALAQNLLLQTDSYKLTHFRQYPPGTQFVYSYLESRGGMFDSTLFFGLQYYLKAYLEGQVFEKQDIYEARDFAKQHFGNDFCFNFEGWHKLYDRYQGQLPVRIRAVPEGLVVPTHNVLCTVENTDPDFPWLTNYLETLLLKVWYPITVAELSRRIKQVIGKALERTGDPGLLNFKLHDFGYRGVSSEETAAIGGSAHLVNFMGTDTIAAVRLLQQFYGAKQMPAFSIPASEHSTITSWGKEHEVDAYGNMLEQYPDGIVACVSDSFDIHAAVADLWGGKLRDKVMQRNGTLVIRPDSGDPVVVLEDIFNTLEQKFGLDEVATAKKGYKVLAPCVRVIQGDGVNYHTIQNMISQLTRKGWSMDNFAFGMGGALLQQLNRDTQRFAFKCSAVNIDGIWHDVFKDPKTDASKASKRGRLSLVDRSSVGTGDFVTMNDPNAYGNILETVFENGKVVKDYTLDEIRARAAQFDDFAS
jgi:nicotinamide phosphoribosyltransferase